MVEQIMVNNVFTSRVIQTHLIEYIGNTNVLATVGDEAHMMVPEQNPRQIERQTNWMVLTARHSR